MGTSLFFLATRSLQALQIYSSITRSLYNIQQVVWPPHIDLATSASRPHSVLNIVWRPCSHITVAIRFLGTHNRVKNIGHLTVITRPPFNCFMMTLQCYTLVMALLYHLWWPFSLFMVASQNWISSIIRLSCGRRNICERCPQGCMIFENHIDIWW